MIRKILTSLLLLSIPFSAYAVRHTVQVGGRFGTAMWLTDGLTGDSPGWVGGIDVNYLCQGRTSTGLLVGMKTGLGIGYSMAPTTWRNYREQYTNIDYYSEPMDYTITAAKYKEVHRQLQLELPLMVQIHTLRGWTFSLGPKVQTTFARQRRLEIVDPYVLTYYPDFEVNVYNELVTGRLSERHTHSGAGVTPTLTALLSAEVGYEWFVPYSDHRFGILAYVDYGLWSNYRNNPSGSRLVDIAPILNRDYPVPDITTHYLTDTYVSRMSYLSAGIRFYYTISYEDIRSCYSCRLLRW